MKRAVVVLALALPAVAHAFTDPALFAQGVDKGGAGGRYFTGSRADKYACSVCHEGGTPLALRITGLPDGIPVAGERYDVRIDWDDPESPIALQLELTTRDGAHPSVMLPDPLPADAHCDHKAEGIVAEYTTDVGARRIVGVTDCNAAAVVFSFLGNGEPIELAVSGVRSDLSETPTGDGTFELRTSIGEHVVATGGACDAAGSAGWLTALVLVVASRASRRRRAR